MIVLRPRWFAGLMMAAAIFHPAAAQEVPEPQTYRMGEYRAPVPSTLDGKPGLGIDEAARLWRDHSAIFVDTLPQAPRPPDLPATTIWHPKERLDIPGSVWLPDTGYGELAPRMLAYLESNLQRVTGGDVSRTLVFYCLANCWMSWNAAKRAESLGYANVLWFRDGTDGWGERNLPLERREPEPRPDLSK